VLCVVESPADVLSIQRVGSYLGQYFVLHGHLSPLDGITPAHLGLDVLKERLKGAEITEVVLATSTTPEGEATAHYISEMARVADVKASRIAYGVPLGGELEYVDGNTLALAISTRRDM
jgi:recombination protein RecR